ncbi:hypothetical protein CS8_001790 [Cupriavidus sp. 8B]
MTTPFILTLVAGLTWADFNFDDFAQPGAQRRNEAIDAIARNGRGEWKKACGYHRPHRGSRT